MYRPRMSVWYNGTLTATHKLPFWERELTPEPVTEGARTIVLTAFLRGSAAGHAGAFLTATNLRKHVDAFLKRSPGLCSADRLHIVHDDPAARALDRHNGAHLHYFSPVRSMPPGDARWGMIADVLSNTTIAWDCAWAVDMTDVQVLRLPECSRSTYGDAGLAIGSDACGLKVAYLRAVASKTNVTVDSPPFREFLQLPVAGVRRPSLASGAPLTNRRQTLNCGLVGGLRAVVLPFIARIAARVNEHHASVPKPPHLPMDMLFVNEAALELEAARGGRLVVSGYPAGPVNLPMWGGISEATSCCPQLHADPFEWRRGRAVVCMSACKVAWANATMGHYWFGHKLQSWWLRFNAEGLKASGPRSSCSQSHARPSVASSSLPRDAQDRWDGSPRKMRGQVS